MTASVLSTLALFKTELALGGLAIFGLLADMFLPKTVERGRALTRIALVGLAVTLGLLVSSWGVFGSAFGGSFVQDGVSFCFKAFFLITGMFVLHMAGQYESKIKRGRGEFVVLILFALTGMCLLSSASEFLLFFVSLETLAVSLYIITAYMRDDDRSIEAGIKFLTLGALSTAILVFGLSFVYGSTGLTNFADIAKAIAAQPEVPLTFYFGAALVLIAMFFKIAAFPFHVWVPDVYEGAPAPITAFLALGSKAAGFAALIKLVTTVFAPIQSQFILPLLAVLSAATIIYGNFGALNQKNIKRMLAYSSIGHAGYLLIGLAALKAGGVEAILVYLAGYLFSTAAAFLVAVWVSAKLGSESISDYAGLGRRSPVMAATMLLAMSSLAGVPPMAGFFGKFYVLSTAVKSDLIWLAAIGLLNVVTSLYYYLGVVKYMYARPAADPSPLQISLSQRVALYAAMAGIIILGAYPTPMIELASQAVRAIVR
jgi:NADH-quinone oxidoreductase subunit N